MLRVTGPHAVDPVADAALPAVARADHRVLGQLGEVDRLQQLAGDGASVEMVDDPPAQLSLAVGLVLAQLGADGAAHELVQGHTAPQRLDERARAQPLESLLRVAVGQRGLEHVERRDTGDRGHRERLVERRLKPGLGQAPNDRTSELGRLPTGGGLPPVIHPRGPRRERQRQRRAARPRDQFLEACVAAEAARQEQRPRLLGRERLELDRGGERFPTAFEPAPLRRPAARDHDDRSLGEGGKEPAAQVAAHRLEPFVGVEQQQRALLFTCPRQGLLERLRHRRKVAALDQMRRPAGERAAALDLPQQPALPDPARAVQQHDAHRRIVDEQSLDEGELCLAADEDGSVATRLPRPERHATGSRLGWRRQATRRQDSDRRQAHMLITDAVN